MTLTDRAAPVVPSEDGIATAAMPKPPAAASRGRDALAGAAWAGIGVLVVVAGWWLVTLTSPGLATPLEAARALQHLLVSPFHDNGPNDKGIGLQLLLSLQRVFVGFALATLVGVPLGFLIGANRRAWQAANPIVQILRPVSPLAWFPIGLAALKNAPHAAVFVIFVTALWPTVINTAAGAGSVPRDQRNVARVFHFGRVAYVRHVLVPHALPSVVTGLRLSMGIAWMVIVAVEMLSGGSGIGFFVWDSYNGSNLANVTAAILLIGAIGFALDAGFLWLSRHVTLEEVPA